MEIVWDDLTGRNSAHPCAVSFDEHGNWGYWLGNVTRKMKRTGGGRFPWEYIAAA